MKLKQTLLLGACVIPLMGCSSEVSLSQAIATSRDINETLLLKDQNENDFKSLHELTGSVLKDNHYRLEIQLKSNIMSSYKNQSFYWGLKFKTTLTDLTYDKTLKEWEEEHSSSESSSSSSSDSEAALNNVEENNDELSSEEPPKEVEEEVIQFEGWSKIKDNVWTVLYYDHDKDNETPKQRKEYTLKEDETNKDIFGIINMYNDPYVSESFSAFTMNERLFALLCGEKEQRDLIKSVKSNGKGSISAIYETGYDIAGEGGNTSYSFTIKDYLLTKCNIHSESVSGWLDYSLYTSENGVSIGVPEFEGFELTEDELPIGPFDLLK